MAKVDVPTYTQRLIDDLKRHEDEFKKKQLESFGKNAELEVKDPFKVSYTVTKGNLDPDILPQEPDILK
jgi:rubrerythrin